MLKRQQNKPILRVHYDYKSKFVPLSGSNAVQIKNRFWTRVIANKSEKISKKGFVYLGGRISELKNIKIDTEFVGSDNYHNVINLELVTSEQIFKIKGNVMPMLPLWNRKEGKTVRIAEGMNEWSWNGKLGYDISEYLDHMEG